MQVINLPLKVLWALPHNYWGSHGRGAGSVATVRGLSLHYRSAMVHPGEASPRNPSEHVLNSQLMN